MPILQKNAGFEGHITSSIRFFADFFVHNTFVPIMNAMPQSPSPEHQLTIVAGEGSGDICGAALARALQTRLPGVESSAVAVKPCGREKEV
jgi:hypothetical protein